MKKILLTAFLLIFLAVPVFASSINRVYDTGTGNIALTVAPGAKYRLICVRGHLSAVGAANSLTITIDSNEGSAYDTVLYTLDMTTVTDFSMTFDEQWFKSGDEIDVAWTNGSAVTYGVELVFEVK